MVTQQIKQAQQQALRRLQLTSPQKLQQEALRTGKTVSQVQHEREVARRTAETTQARKVEAQRIDKILVNAGTISQINEILKDVPEETKQYIKNTSERMGQELTNRQSYIDAKIKEAQEKLKRREKLLRGEIEDSREEGDREGRRRAEDDWEEYQVYHREYVKRLNEGKGRLEKGEIISTADILRFSKTYASAKEDRQQAKNIYKEQQRKQQKAFETKQISEMSSIEKYQYESFKASGYSASEAMKIASWSETYKGSSPGPELITKY